MTEVTRASPRRPRLPSGHHYLATSSLKHLSSPVARASSPRRHLGLKSIHRNPTVYRRRFRCPKSCASFHRSRAWMTAKRPHRQNEPVRNLLRNLRRSARGSRMVSKIEIRCNKYTITGTGIARKQIHMSTVALAPMENTRACEN